MLAYLSRYTHRIAIANSRLVAFDGERVTFKWKDYRAKGDARYKLMTLDADEFIRRFLIHVLPDGFHRIRHYGLFANANRADNIALARRLLGVPDPAPSSRASDRRRKWSRRRRVERLSLLRRAYDHRRDLRTRLPAPALAHPIDRARQLMTNTLLSPSPIAAACPTPISHRQRPHSADGNRQPRLRPPKPRSSSTASPCRPHPRRPKPPPRYSLKPSFLSEPTQSEQTPAPKSP